MKRILHRSFCLAIIFGLSRSANAQIQVYRGDGHVVTAQVLHFANHRIYPGYSLNFNDVLYTVLGNEIMVGGSGSVFDKIYTFRDGKLYSGNAMYTSQIAYTLEDGKIYKGNSTFLLDQLYTYQNGTIYVGNQTSPFDALFFVDGDPRPAELFGILLGLGLIR